MPQTDVSIPALLRTRATERPEVTAYTFMDGALDGGGYPESLTWEQVYRRSLVVENAQRLDKVKREVSTAIWQSHNLRIGDLVLASPGSIPITTSRKIRRSSRGDLYRQGELQRLGIAV